MVGGWAWWVGGQREGGRGGRGQHSWRPLPVTPPTPSPSPPPFLQVVDDSASAKMLLVMDYMEGGPVLGRAALERGQRVPEPLARLYFRDMASVCGWEGVCVGWWWGGGMQRFNAAAIPFAAPSEHSHTHPSLSGPGLPPLPEGGAWGLEARERAHVRRPPRRPLRLWVQVWRVWLGGWVCGERVWVRACGLTVGCMCGRRALA